MDNTKIKEFVPGIYDHMFKAILTDPNLKDYLVYLISEITSLDYDYVYQNIVINNSELRVKNKNQKRYKTDILINIENNRVNIEANRVFSEGLVRKNNKYQHSLASEEEVGKVYSSGFIYQINFNGYNIFQKEHNIIDKVMLTNVKTGEIEEEMFQRYHVNLAEIKKKYYNKEKLSLFEKRCLILILQNKNQIEEIVGQDEMMGRIYEKMKELNKKFSILDYWDEEKELEKARNYDLKIAKEKAEIEGREKGMKEGMKEGKAKEKINIIKNMLDNHMDIELISKVTGVTIDEIKSLSH